MNIFCTPTNRALGILNATREPGGDAENAGLLCTRPTVARTTRSFSRSCLLPLAQQYARSPAMVTRCMRRRRG